MLTNRDKIKAVNYNGTAIPLDNITLPYISDTFYKDIVNKSILSIPSYIYLDKIGDYTFYSCPFLLDVDVPNCSYISNYAFQNCPALLNVKLYTCESIGFAAFSSCSNLKNINLTNVTFIDSYAFSGCKKLSNIESVKNITALGKSVFNSISISNFDFNKLSKAGDNIFDGYRNSTHFYLPNISYVGYCAFRDCYNATFSIGSYIASISAGGFLSCSKLRAINLKRCTHLNSDNALGYCYNLYIIRLGSSCTLQGSRALQNSPITTSSYLGYYGSIYVPAHLVEYYKASTNWNYYSDRITSIENLPEEYKEWQE